MSVNKSQPIFQKTFHRVFAAIVMSTALLFAGISLLVSAEFSDELDNRSIRTAELILSFVSALPKEQLQNPGLIQSLQETDKLDYVLAVYHQGQRIYASPLDFVLEEPAPELSKLHSGNKTYSLSHQSDPDLGLHITIGIATSEAFFSSLEIVLVTVLIFLVATLLMVYLTRQAIRKGLIPISDLANAVSDREPARMNRLDPDESPTELQPIVHATNTLLKRLKSALESERAFAANAAHELRTPLAGILAQAGSVNVEELSPDARKALQLIKESAHRSSRQIGQLLDHAFAHNHAMELPLEKVDIGALLQQVMIDVLPQALAVGVEVELNVESEIRAELPGVLLGLVVRNLLENAIKHSSAHGKVEVTLSATNTAIKIQIDDAGPGLTEAEFVQYSTRFRRHEHSRGHGLGLAIVHELCERLHIQIGCGTSDVLGGFSVRLLMERS